MTTGFLFIPTTLPRFVSPGLLARNTTSPQATSWQEISNRLCHTLRWRRKQLFAWNGTAAWLGKGGASRSRWRFRARTGTLAARISARVHMALVDGTGTDPYVEIVGTPVGGGTTVTLTIHAGGASTVAVDVTTEGSFAYVSADCDEEKEYTFVVTEYGSARLVSACVFEESKLPQTDNGYPQSRWSAGSPILDAYRQQQLALATTAYRLNSAHLFSWAVNQYTVPKTTASVTVKNIIDNSTTYGADTPGAYVNLEYCNTVGRTTVPVELAVYASVTGGAGSGEFSIRDSAGSAPAGLSTTSITTEGWYKLTGNLPATEAKYNFVFSRTGIGTLNVWGVTLAMYDP